MQFAVGQSKSLEQEWSMSTSIGRHTVWVGIALFTFLIGQIIDARFWRTLAYPIFGFSLVLLVLVLIFGHKINDARSWFIIGSFSFQPGEFAKFGTVLALCAYLSSFQTRLKNLKSQAVALGLIFAPILLVLLQPDPGSALVFLSFFILFFREGMPAAYYGISIFSIVCMLSGLLFPIEDVMLILSLLIVLFFSFNIFRRKVWLMGLVGLTGFILFHYTYKPIPISVLASVLTLATGGIMYKAWTMRQKRVVSLMPLVILIGISMASVSDFVFENVLKPHHQDRINAWLQPSKCDPQGSLYNIIQSKVAIGSGGLAGKGFLEGSMTQLNFVPEQATDFIFSTIGEEQGFIGSLVVIFLFIALLLRVIYLGETRDNAFIRIYAYGFASILFCHVFINIGMTMGLVPVVGIPLPFISKGGSALIIFTLMLSVFLRLSKSRL